MRGNEGVWRKRGGCHEIVGASLSRGLEHFGRSVDGPRASQRRYHFDTEHSWRAPVHFGHPLEVDGDQVSPSTVFGNFSVRQFTLGAFLQIRSKSHCVFIVAFTSIDFQYRQIVNPLTNVGVSSVKFRGSLYAFALQLIR